MDFKAILRDCLYVFMLVHLITSSARSKRKKCLEGHQGHPLRCYLTPVYSVHLISAVDDWSINLFGFKDQNFLIYVG